MFLRWLPSIVTIGAALAMVWSGPIAQFADYHNFADQRTLLGVPHTLDVLSNAGFAIVAVRGWRIRQPISSAGTPSSIFSPRSRLQLWCSLLSGGVIFALYRDAFQTSYLTPSEP